MINYSIIEYFNRAPQNIPCHGYAVEFSRVKSSRIGLVHVVCVLAFDIQRIVNFDCPLEVDR